MAFLKALLIVSCIFGSVAAWPWSHHQNSKEDNKYTSGLPSQQVTSQIPPSPLAENDWWVHPHSSLSVYDSPKKEGVAVPATEEEYTGPFGTILRIFATIVHPISTATTAPPPPATIAPPPPTTSAAPTLSAAAVPTTPTITSPAPTMVTQAVMPETVAVLPVPQALVGETPSSTSAPSTAWKWNDGTAPATLTPGQISTTTPMPASAMPVGPFKAAIVATALLVVGTLLL